MNGSLIKTDTMGLLQKKNGGQVIPALYRSLCYKWPCFKDVTVFLVKIFKMYE